MKSLPNNKVFPRISGRINMIMNETNNIQLKNFDKLFTGNPSDIEKNMSDLLPEAEQKENKSIYLQILSQIALAQAMQKKFESAHETLDKAEELLKPEYKLARIRLLLERGRVYHQVDDTKAALSFFIKSYNEAKKERDFDFHSVNAAHMIAIVEDDINAKIKWNKIALSLTEKSRDKRCQDWPGVIHNNLAQAYIESSRFFEALQSFQKSKQHADDREEHIVSRGAYWGMARALRSMDRLDQALEIQNTLLSEYETLASNQSLPTEIICSGRGLVYEELSEICIAKNDKDQAKKYALLAYEDLSKDPWMKKLFPSRIKRMYELSNEQEI